ncbi:type I-E CRISPR-associated endoribonuclease Cas2 [Actinobacteria bacterium YIM 96077]|uniref:Type I-E CRISPR-associated endoribonuclease Cas2 n=1 Tax=Phytoactinopolyspora halophila TaxID=1981511 RepID=A0A329QHY8_9ACTN|nr:type I-E CRISPR-associated endoribonuclease Cas2e [Phytoactinopolyspora halophila]AYY12437.1 type I-E CRISPR-associated endoribonuclease Cas2 [Actinobacteria bacterium YIM 96077]RAW11985.1 type I-E CRISPR-associated endoribonuclease Cas2 [Phytoactinopolyspora halophila]
MTIVVLTAVPPGLRGHLTRWLLEISPGVFVGYVSARVRQHMWERVVEFVEDGRALLVYAVSGEQRLAFEVHGHDWTPVDYDGVMLMRRQTAPDYVPAPSAPMRQQRAGSTASDETVWKRRDARKKFRKK